jgi:hypothetical protein
LNLHSAGEGGKPSRQASRCTESARLASPGPARLASCTMPRHRSQVLQRHRSHCECLHASCFSHQGCMAGQHRAPPCVLARPGRYAVGVWLDGLTRCSDTSFVARSASISRSQSCGKAPPMSMHYLLPMSMHYSLALRAPPWGMSEGSAGHRSAAQAHTIMWGLRPGSFSRTPAAYFPDCAKTQGVALCLPAMHLRSENRQMTRSYRSWAAAELSGIMDVSCFRGI